MSGAGLPMVVFTIATRSHIPYAKNLHRTLTRHEPGAHFVLALCDERGGFDRAALPFDVLDLADLRDFRVWEMAERYGVTELCTAIKPLVFTTLMLRFPGHVICYFDPDIEVMSPLPELHAAFADGAAMVLTPHRTAPGSRPELFGDANMLRFGIYNLGFLGLRDSAATRALMVWWAARLEQECLVDLAHGLFVDQKWADSFPALLDGVHVLRHPGYNVAWWNLLERPVRCRLGVWTAGGEPLRFVHFSGHDLTRPEQFSRNAPYLGPEAVGDLQMILDRYREGVLAAGLVAFSALPYAFRWDGAAGPNLHTPAAIGARLLDHASTMEVTLPPFARPGQIREGALFSYAVASWEDFRAQSPRYRTIVAAQRAAELDLLPPGERPFDIPGACSMCGAPASFHVSFVYASERTAEGTLLPNWREHAYCRAGHVNRMRAAMHALRVMVAPPERAAIYVTEQVTPVFDWLKLRWPATTGSEFLDAGLPGGTIRDGIRHEDLTRLSFFDASFDVVISLDVLEHVERLEAALTECHRVLRPGGTLLLAAPLQVNAPGMVERVRVLADGTYDHLAPAEYHGNPLDPNKGSLCFRYLGLDVLDVLRGIGFETAECVFYWSLPLGYLGTDQNYIMATKAP